jgi:uncharacterized protein (TIGR02391 family)
MFGIESPRYQSYSIITPLDTTSPISLHHIPIEEVRASVSKRSKDAISVLRSIQKGFQRDLQGKVGGKSANTLTAYNSLDLHPRIAEATSALYRNEHYSEAILKAAITLVTYVKEKSGRHDLDGTPLMLQVFSKNNPVLKFNSLATASDKDEQEGFMHLFAGAVLGIRNPRAHAIISDDPEKALEFIAFLSLLAKLVDQTHI